MSRASAARCTPVDAGQAPAVRVAKGYFQRSELPWTSLVFLLPFIILYEVGTRLLLTDADGTVENRIIAFTKLQDFFRWCGATGPYLPAMAVVGILLACHIARRDTWDVAPRHLFGMLLESAVLAIPLLVLATLAVRYVPLMAVTRPLPGMLVLSIGAGIYEELVFRLIAFTLLSVVIIDGLRIEKRLGYLLIVVITSLGFSLYHYWGHEAFQLRAFAFRTVAGLYFGLIFAFRGFGITAGSHASYDVLVHILRAWA